MVDLNREFLEFLVERNKKYTLTNLSVIDISWKQIKNIDSNTFKDLTKVEILWLFNNEIEEIEIRLFETLSNLKWLDLSHNKLKRIEQFRGIITV